jgi:hypothetical protein
MSLKLMSAAQLSAPFAADEVVSALAIMAAREIIKRITYRTFRTHKNPEREVYAICASMYSHGRM